MFHFCFDICHELVVEAREVLLLCEVEHFCVFKVLKFSFVFSSLNMLQLFRTAAHSLFYLFPNRVSKLRSSNNDFFEEQHWICS